MEHVAATSVSIKRQGLEEVSASGETAYRRPEEAQAASGALRRRGERNELGDARQTGNTVMTRERRSGILVLLAVLMSTAPTMGAPPPNTDPSLSPWFNCLQRPDGTGSCCSTADCRRVQSRLANRGYEVLLDGVWVAVPPNTVIHRDNPTGDAVACMRGHLIFCFVPAPEA